MHVGMSELLLRAQRPGGRHAASAASQELGEHTGLPQNPYRWRVAMAGLRQAEGDLRRRARSARRGRARVRRRLLSRTCARSPAFEGAGAGSRRGRLADALGWVREHGLSAEDELELPARVRAHHPGPGAACPAQPRDAQRRALRRGRRAPRAAAPSSRGRRPDGERHRDPGAAGARTAAARRRPAALVPLERALRSPNRRATSESSWTRGDR